MISIKGFLFFVILWSLSPAVAAESCRQIFVHAASGVPASVTMARDLLQKQELLFDQAFAQSAGSTYPKFVESIRTHQDPLIKKAQGFIDENKVEVYMRASENIRELIMTNGFLNQFQTHTSGGELNSKDRLNTEATMMGMKVDDYAKLDNELKPKYGSLKLTDDLPEGSSTREAVDYGEDVFIFRKDKVADRMTFFPEDSLTHFSNEAHAYNKGAWHLHLIPWSRNYLMIPFMTKSLSFGGMVTRPQYDQYRFRLDNQPIMLGRYWEVQIFGALSLGDVQAYQFSKTPPSGRFLKALQERGIRIFDLRSGTPTPWNGTP